MNRIGKRIRAALAAFMAEPAEEAAPLLIGRPRPIGQIDSESVALAIVNGMARNRRFKTQRSAEVWCDKILGMYPDVRIMHIIESGTDDTAKKPYRVRFARTMNLLHRSDT